MFRRRACRFGATQFRMELLIEACGRRAQKCARCWRVVPDVGADARWPKVCARCADALEPSAFRRKRRRPHERTPVILENARRCCCCCCAAVVIVLDRLSKLWVEAHVELGSCIVVIPQVFRISHVLNTGAAFSMFEDATHRCWCATCWSAFSVVAVVAVLGLLWRMGRTC